MPARSVKQRLVFGSTGWAMDFVDCEGILARLPEVFQGWNLKVGSVSDFPGNRPRGIITKRANGWHWQERGAAKAKDWDLIPPRTPMRVITDVHDAAIYWFLDENPDHLCLHGGAVKIGRGLVCFPARGRTGKSTLIATLAAHGHKIFCDDVLGLSPPAERGVSLGLQPRLRVPLAPNLSRPVKAFIESHSGPVDGSWHYLKLGPTHLAGLGESAPIKSFVILERHDTGKAQLTEAGTAEVLKDLIAENIIRQLPMAEIFDRLHRLASSRRKYRLRYCNPGEAARLLAKAFA